jgi:hypothetical protein
MPVRQGESKSRNPPDNITMSFCSLFTVSNRTAWLQHVLGLCSVLMNTSAQSFMMFAQERNSFHQICIHFAQRCNSNVENCSPKFLQCVCVCSVDRPLNVAPKKEIGLQIRICGGATRQDTRGRTLKGQGFIGRVVRRVVLMQPAEASSHLK